MKTNKILKNVLSLIISFSFIICACFGLFSFVVLMIGTTYAIFQYMKEGLEENSITTGAITFYYDEQKRQGNGIQIENAFPMSDLLGENQEGVANVFRFQIQSDTMSKVSIPYTITARMKEGSDLPQDAIKIYLT